MPTPLHVLILEDRPDDAELMVDSLHEAGFAPVWQRVETESDYLAHLHARLDVILADYALPQFDALRALHHLQERGLDIPFIVITGGFEDMAVECLTQGAADYLLKDRLARLGQAVQRALHEKTLREEQRQAVAALRDSEEHYRRLFEANPHAMWVYDLETLAILAVNEAAVHTYGYTREAFVAMTIKDLRPPEDISALLANLTHLPTGYDPPDTWRHCKKDGTLIDVEVTSNRIQFGGRPARLVLAQDVTARKQAEAEIEQRRQEADVLAELARNVSASLDLDTVLMRVSEGARALCRSDTSSLALREPHTEAMRLRYWNGVRWPESQALRVEPGQGVGGQVLVTGRPFRTALYAEDPHVIPDFRQRAFLQGLVAVMAVPIWIGARIEGLLYVANCTARPFTDHDEAILQRLAAHAAVAIQNAYLYQQQAQQQEEVRALLEINTTLGQVRELPTLLNAIAAEAARLLGVPEVIFRLREGDELFLAGTWEQARIGSNQRILQVGESLSGWVAATGEPLLVNDLTHDDRLLPEHRARLLQAGYVAYLGVPLRLAGEVIGVMAFNAERTHPFTDHDRDMAIAFADQAAIAVRHARLYTQAERLYTQAEQRRRAAESLTEMTRLLSQSLDPTEVGQRIVATIRPLLKSKSALLYQREPHSGDLHLLAVATDGTSLVDVPRMMPQGTNVAGLAIRERRPMVSPNILTDPRLSLSPELRAYFAQLPPRTVLSAPLMLHDEVIGVLGIGDNAGREFTAEEIRLVQAFATQAATALRNARLYQEAQDAYHQLAHTQEQFVQAQKMEAVGRLAGGIAHDFNNLLTVISGRTQLQLLGLPGDHPMRPDLELIQNTAERAATLTRQLLAFSRRQLLQPQILDLNALIRDISQLLRRLIGEDITLVTVLDPTLGQLRADPSQLSQVLLNLAINARDAMPHGGQLTIETANVTQQEEDKREAPRIPPGQYVQLRCSDTGVGMDTTVQAHLFEPFFTTKEVGKGTGLGLATVYGIVTQSGGHIAVDSALGRGTTFTLSLPRSEADPITSPPSQTPPTLTRGHATILVVEDETHVRELAYDILTATGYRVLSARNGVEALQRCAQNPGAIDLLLTDVVMPGMSGQQLALWVMRRWPHMKVLYMSGYTDEMLNRHGVLDPSIAIVEKPFSPESLTRKVHEVLLANHAADRTGDGGLDRCKES